MPSKFFMIVGAQKCGTTSMHNWLDQHPDISMSSPKEPQFFEREYWRGSDVYHMMNYRPDFRNYAAYGEARVYNLILPWAPLRVLQYDGNARIVVMVRNPIDRLISAHAHFQTMRPGREIRTLEEMLYEQMRDWDPNLYDSEESYCTQLDDTGGPYNPGYIETGFYINHIENWARFFEVKVVVMEDLIRHPKIVYESILDFLEIYYPDNEIDFVKLNSKSKRNLYDIDREVAAGFYKNSVDRLSEYMQRDLTTEWGFNHD